ncbi:MAG: sulfotransferase [Cyanothece sp. SIO2G6]|nr:sulfotransferase [Cyanothece sp. SIO2G6]
MVNILERIQNRIQKTSKQFQRPSTLKIFGIGTLKTGTTTLGAALEKLGFNHTHEDREYLLSLVREDNLEKVYQWVDQYDSFEDWPWPLIYKELAVTYPKSRFILTTRENEEKWLRSMVKHSEKFGPTKGREMFFGHGAPQGNEVAYVDRYLQHNQEVRDYFKDQPDRLLEVCWEQGDDWEKLCSFLGLPLIEEEFPKVNTASNRINK